MTKKDDDGMFSLLVLAALAGVGIWLYMRWKSTQVAIASKQQIAAINYQLMQKQQAAASLQVADQRLSAEEFNLRPSGFDVTSKKNSSTYDWGNSSGSPALY